MTWAKLDDAILDNEKIAKAGIVGFAFHVAAITWCARNLTDGFVPSQRVACLLDVSGLVTGFLQATRAAVPAVQDRFIDAAEDMGALDCGGIAQHLVACGLWKADPERDGYWLNDYLEYNPSREKVLAERARKASNKQRSREQQEPSGPSASVSRLRTVAADVSAPVTGDTPARHHVPVPVPVPVPKQPSVVSSEAAQAVEQTLADRSQAVLDNPHDGRYSRPSKWPEVAAAAAALGAGRALRLRDDPGKDADLRAILDAFAAGYSVAELERAGAAARTDAWFQKLDRPGPCAFTATVLRRLLAEKPPGQLAHEAANGSAGAGGRKWTETGRDASGKPCAWTDENGRTTYKNPFQEAS